jgi:hypothetical protein
LNGSQNAGLLATVADRALIIPPAFDESFAHEGIKPIESGIIRDGCPESLPDDGAMARKVRALLDATGVDSARAEQ